jgi:GNAT superfamily N-acetyltransferase
VSRTLVERARSLEASLYINAAERVLTLSGATILSTPSLPTVSHLNTVLVHSLLDGPAIEALCDRYHRGLPNRRAVVDEEATSDELRADLAARGWLVHRAFLLGREATPVDAEAELAAREVRYDEVRELRDEWLRGPGWELTGTRLAETLEADNRLVTSTPVRAYACFVNDRPAAYGLLFDRGPDGLVEDVYTTPRGRGRGFATSVLSALLRATESEGHTAVFVLTAAEGGAAPLYEKLGFVLLATQYYFTKSVD